MEKQVTDEDVLTIAREIRDYLTAHPNALDSLEGIAKWWLARQHYVEQLSKVQKALNYLVDQGVLIKQRTSDGKTLYRVQKSNPAATTDY